MELRDALVVEVLNRGFGDWGRGGWGDSLPVGGVQGLVRNLPRNCSGTQKSGLVSNALLVAEGDDLKPKKKKKRKNER